MTWRWWRRRRRCAPGCRSCTSSTGSGPRTSSNTIEMLGDDDLRALIADDLVRAHRARALSPEHPFIRGTAQNPDAYFQARETVNPFYAARARRSSQDADGPACASAPAASYRLVRLRRRIRRPSGCSS